MLLAEVLPTELIKLLPDGAVSVAIITVVILFLKQQDKSAIMIKEIAEAFQETIKEIQVANQIQIAEMYKQNTEMRIHFQTQIQTLMDGHLRMTQEVIETIHDLKVTVNSLKGGDYGKHTETPPK